MDNQQATDFEIGWLAGIVDGEGWLGMGICHDSRDERSYRNRKTVKVELSVNNCDEPIIQKTAAIMRKLGINPYLRTCKETASRRLVHYCQIKNMTNVEKALLPILDHLTGNKRQRADIILQFIALRRKAVNVIAPSPTFNDRASGRRGRRNVYLRPYSEEELTLVQMCRDLQSRGASETTRETRDKAVQSLIKHNACRLPAVPAMI